ncbi:MAG: ABC transporter permease [Nitrospinae bacterium]|nr:ABC transporter permease [Nitrospinota bacterium]
MATIDAELETRHEWPSQLGEHIGVAVPTQARSQAAIVWRRFSRDRMALAGGAIVVIAVLLSMFAPLLSPRDPIAMDPTARLALPGTGGYLLGADESGRDILSRLVWGGRVSLIVAIGPVLCAALTSLALGLIAGFQGGLAGQLIMRTLDVLFAFPRVIFAIALAAALGSGMSSVMVALWVGMVPYITRVVYSSTQSLKTLQFVEAARCAGATTRQIMLHEILVNVLAPLIVYSTTLVGLMVVIGAGLSFLGLGVQPPTPDWGIMVSGGRRVLAVAPHVSTIPGIVILIVSVAFNLLGDGLRDALDPRLRTRID